MKLHLFSSGTITAWKHLLVRGAPEGVRIVVPVPFYLIEHEKGLVLFDTGQQIPQRRLPDDASFISHVSEEDRAVLLLKKRGVEPEKIKYIILSHHHSDHTEGVPDFPAALCIIRKEELQYSPMKELKQQNSDREWIHPEGNFDLFGDGSVICIPTPGHTLGHQSLLLRLDDGKQVLLTADAAYTEAALKQIPPEHEKALPYWKTIGMFRKFMAEGVQMITGHDPEVWNDLQKQFL